jgi:cytochrome c oxidase subunit IV
MSDAHSSESHSHAPAHGHAGPALNLYLVIFIALSVFTVVSFVVNWAVREKGMGAHTGFAIILGVAVAKATLVGLYFMHLKFDWGRLYFIIVPVMIMGILLVVVLLPDIVLAWHVDRAMTSP